MRCRNEHSNAEGGSIGGLFAAKMVKSGIKTSLSTKRKDGENSDDWHYNSRIEDFTVPTDSLLSKHTRGRSSTELSLSRLSNRFRKVYQNFTESLIEVANYLEIPKNNIPRSFKWNWLGGNCNDKFGKSRVLAATTTHAAIRQKEPKCITYTGIGKVTLGSINATSVESYFEIMKLFEKSDFPLMVDDGSVAI